jgi:uncharacterized zinc-type alcohol dehydrogenase-like protein
MLATRGYAVKSPTSTFEPFDFERREVGPKDVLIKILYSGICHSDIHQVKNEWGGAIYPMVPGHEIAGKVIRVGSEVKKFKIDDVVGVGCFVDSCRACHSCKESEEQFCEKHVSYTYSGTEQDLKTPTYGGYSSQIVVDENYVLSISSKLPLENVAPLLCAGITTYSPLKRFNVRKGSRVAVVGLGGLGHMGLKFASKMGAEVTMLSTSPSKEEDARRLGAHKFVITTDSKNLEAYNNYFDFILVTISAEYDVNKYLILLRKGGVMVLVGIPEKSLNLQPISLIGNRRQIAGSLIGGIRETQEMLDFCAEKNITSDIEIIPIQKLEEAYTRTLKSQVKFRFVIDMSSLGE